MEVKDVFIILDHEFRMPEAPIPPVFPWEEKGKARRVVRRRIKRRIKK